MPLPLMMIYDDDLSHDHVNCFFHHIYLYTVEFINNIGFVEKVDERKEGTTTMLCT